MQISMKGEHDFMNWEFIIKYIPLYEKAAKLTVKIGGVIGIVLAILIGLICAMIQYHKIPVAKADCSSLY